MLEIIVHYSRMNDALNVRNVNAVIILDDSGKPRRVLSDYNYYVSVDTNIACNNG